jgi:ribosomal-protein-alanine N-acetyltransferase
VSVTLRRWCLDDAEFVCKVRNTPELQQWFRQSSDLTVEKQRAFMNDHWEYKGYIITVDGKRIGMCALVVLDSEKVEFGIAVLPKYQGKGYAKEAMEQLCRLAFKQFQAKCVFSEVFVKNPALPFYLWKCGFKATGVRERAYYKKGVGMIDVVWIEREAE